MTARRWLIAGLGLLALAPLLLAAALRHYRHEEAFDLVRAAATAHERVDYRGSIAWRRTKWAPPSTVVHDADTGATQYELPGWRGRPFRFVRQGPSTRAPDPAGFCLHIDALAESYRAELEASETFLGRRARRVLLTGRDEGRPSLRVTIDAETCLPLKVVYHRADGSHSRTIAFRELEIAPQDVEPRSGSRLQMNWFGRKVSAAELARAVDFDLYEPAYLPAGFRCIERRLRLWETTHVTHVYSDGATAFEIRQARVPTPAAMELALAKRVGPERARWHCDRIIEFRSRKAAWAGPVALRKKGPRHYTYDLQVDDHEIHLKARGDLAPSVVEDILRSMKTP